MNDTNRHEKERRKDVSALLTHDRITGSVRKQLRVVSDEMDGYSYHLHTSRGDTGTSECPVCHTEAVAKQMVAHEHHVWVVVCVRC